MAITVGAGVQDGELFEFAEENNVVAVGGTNKVNSTRSIPTSPQ